MTPVIGVIGGSGLYDIDGLQDREWREQTTPWGEPSDALLHGVLSFLFNTVIVALTVNIAAGLL